MIVREDRGPTPPRSAFGDARRLKVLALRREGLTYKEIGAAVGVRGNPRKALGVGRVQEALYCALYREMEAAGNPPTREALETAVRDLTARSMEIRRLKKGSEE